jgi:putative lumazine-binding protein
MRVRFIVAGVLILAASMLIAASQKNPEEAAVRRAVEHYLHGLKFNDVSDLKAAFFPEAKLFFVKRDGQLGQLTQEQWYKGFEASAGKEEKGDLRIVAVDVTGNAASVKVVETYDTSIYTDYLSLLKWNGEWKIVNKIYAVEPRSTK